jgi:hypothetical protein
MPQETISREMKTQLIKAVFDKEVFDQIVAKASPYILSDIQEFLWEAILYVGKDEKSKPITRDSITSKMMPTGEYWRSQLCGEPLDTCRGRSCFVSHPVCAGNKLKGQIEVIRQLFDRRRHRSGQSSDGLMMFLMYHVNGHQYAAGGIYGADRKPQLTVGSRVLSGDSLRNVIQAMNVAVGQNFLEDAMRQTIIIGESKLNVFARKVPGTSGSDQCIVALTVPNDEKEEELEKVFKHVTSGIKRISAHMN